MSCCGGNTGKRKPGASQSTDPKKPKLDDEAKGQDIHEMVRNYYGKVLTSSKDLKTDACCTTERPHEILLNALKLVPNEIKDKYYGCGSPLPFGIEGLHVLDLGSGSGRDCYVSANLVGPSGSVTGVDFTDEQLGTANAHIDEYMKTLGYKKHNLRFVKGYIELLDKAGIASNSIDLVISNCVLNLSPNKKRVIEEVFRVLKDGGEFYFSDVYCDRRLPEHIQKHDVLVGECLGGALYIEDFKRICHKAGFTDPRVVSSRPMKIGDKSLGAVLGNAKFYSITYRLFKLKSLETVCEDYGQYAVYHGSIPGHEHNYPLDDHHLFMKNKPMLVCGNSASMITETFLGKHFTVTGNRETHYGLFDCSDSKSASSPVVGGSCC